MHDRRLMVLVCAVLALTGLIVAPAAGAARLRAPSERAPVAGRARVPAAPAPVSHVHFYAVRAGVSVHWHNPAPQSFDHVVLRYVRGYTAPTRSTLGRGVRLAGRKATVGRLGGLTPNTVYTVAVWTVDGQGTRSAPAKRTFTSGALRGRRGDYVGRVVDDEKHPLLNVEVSAIEYTGDGTISGHTRTDIHGRFRLRLVPGTWKVGFGGQQISDGDSDASGYLGSEAQIVVHAGTTVRAGDVGLTPGGAVSGRVTDDAGHPLAGVEAGVVPLQPQATGNGTDAGVEFGFVFGASDAVLTAGDGRYTVKGLPVSKALKVCMATAAGPVAGGESDGEGYSDRCLPSGVLVRRGGVAAEPDLALDAAFAGSISGTLTTPSGMGLGDWLLTFDTTSPESGTIDGYAVTRPDGSYEAEGLSPGAYRVCASYGHEVDTSRTGYLGGCRRSLVAVSAGRRATGDLTLRRGAAVSGRVLGPGGVPLAGAVVAVYDPDFNYATSGFTDATGHYTVTGVPPGKRVACVDPSGLRAPGLPTGAAFGCFDHGAVFTALAGAVRTGIDVRLGPAGAISGTLHDSAGKPVPYAEVDVDSLDTEDDNDGGVGETNAAGNYVVPGLEASEYRVCFRKDADDLSPHGACHRGHVRVGVGRTTTGIDGVIGLVKNSSISITVHDTAGRPVAGVETVLLSPCPKLDGCKPEPLFNPRTDVSLDATAVTNAAGTDTQGDLNPGRYAVCLFAYYAATTSGTAPDGYADRCSGSTATIIVRSGRRTAVHETISDGGALSGTVTDGAGHPLAGVMVNVTHSAAEDYLPNYFPDGNPASEGPSDDSVTRTDGTFTIRSVQPGTSTVCADAIAARGPDPAGYLNQCLGGTVGSTTVGSAIPVTAEEDRVGTDLALTPAAGISGTVDDGNTSSDIDILIYAGHSKRMVADETLDSSGGYTITQLPAGRYSVCAEDDDDGHGQCYRDLAWTIDGHPPPLNATTLVTASAGAFVTGIDFRISA